jgi:hypothetical protein
MIWAVAVARMTGRGGTVGAMGVEAMEELWIAEEEDATMTLTRMTDVQVVVGTGQKKRRGLRRRSMQRRSLSWKH